MVNRRTVLSVATLLASIFIIIVVLLMIGVDLFLNLASRLHPAWVALFLLAYTTSFILRAARWKVIVKATGGNVNIKQLMSINFSGWFINEVTPARIGDLLRISLLSSHAGVSLGESTSTIAVERTLDIFSIILLSSALLFTTNFSPIIPLHVKLIAVIGFIVLTAILILTLIFCVSGPGIINFFRLDKLSEKLYRTVYGLTLGMRDGIRKLARKPKFLALTAILSPPIWVVDAFSIYLFINAAGIPEFAQTVTLAILAGVYPAIWLTDSVTLTVFMSPLSSVSAGICLLSTLLGFASKFFPVIPGGFGIYEFIVAVVLNIVGFPLNLGLAVALLDHMARLTYCSATGIPSLLQNGIHVGSVISGQIREKPKEP